MADSTKVYIDMCLIINFCISQQVMKVLRVWQSWTVYPNPYLHGLHATFFRLADDTYGNNDLSYIIRAEECNIDGEDLLDEVDSVMLGTLLDANFDEMEGTELERLCRQHGVSTSSTDEKMRKRLRYVQLYASEREKKKRALSSATTSSVSLLPDYETEKDKEKKKKVLKDVGMWVSVGSESKENEDDGDNVDGDDLDGAPLLLEDYQDIDGEDIDGEDVDGEPMSD
tara:strand:- start:170 stop:850 length:681 start_codon:yes stop_codon:yes gene_type:complete